MACAACPVASDLSAAMIAFCATRSCESCKVNSRRAANIARAPTPNALLFEIGSRIRVIWLIGLVRQHFPDQLHHFSGCERLDQVFVYTLELAHETVCGVAVGRHHDDFWTTEDSLRFLDGIKHFPASHIWQGNIKH